MEVWRFHQDKLLKHGRIRNLASTGRVVHRHQDRGMAIPLTMTSERISEKRRPYLAERQEYYYTRVYEVCRRNQRRAGAYLSRGDESITNQGDLSATTLLLIGTSMHLHNSP